MKTHGSGAGEKGWVPLAGYGMTYIIRFVVFFFLFFSDRGFARSRCLARYVQ